MEPIVEKDLRNVVAGVERFAASSPTSSYPASFGVSGGTDGRQRALGVGNLVQVHPEVVVIYHRDPDDLGYCAFALGLGASRRFVYNSTAGGLQTATVRSCPRR